MHPTLATLLPRLQENAGQGAPAASGGPSFLPPLLLIFAVFWFVLILPERKQRKKRQEMIDALKKGDRVLTTAGIFGTVVQAQDDVVTLQVADGVRLRFAKAAVQTVLGEEDGAASAEAGKK